MESSNKYYDLNIKFSSEKTTLPPPSEVICAQEYGVVALNHDLYSSPSAKNTLEINTPQFTQNPIPQQYSRVTYRDGHITKHLDKYQLLVCRPQNEKAFNEACVNGNQDMISLKLQVKLPFRLKLKLIKLAVKRGMMFEVCYSPSIRNPFKRRCFIQNATELIRATRGANIVMSSGASTIFDQRSPHDVINLAWVIGLKQEQAHASITSNPAHVIKRSEVRSQMTSAIFTVSKTSEFLEANPEASAVLDLLPN